MLAPLLPLGDEEDVPVDRLTAGTAPPSREWSSASELGPSSLLDTTGRNADSGPSWQHCRQKSMHLISMTHYCFVKNQRYEKNAFLKIVLPTKLASLKILYANTSYDHFRTCFRAMPGEPPRLALLWVGVPEW